MSRVLLFTGQGGYIPCKQAFLFTLVNPFRLWPAKMPVILQMKQCAMRCNSSHGPVFMRVCMTCSYQIMPTQIPLVAAISAKPINGLKKDSSSCLQVVQSSLSQTTKCLNFTSSDKNRWVGMGRVAEVTKTRIRSGRRILWPKLAGKSI